MLFKDKTNCSFYLRKLFNKSTLTKTLEPHICLLFPSFLSAKARQAPFNTERSFPSNFSKRQFWPHSHSKYVVLGQLDICRTTTTCNILQDKPHLKEKERNNDVSVTLPTLHECCNYDASRIVFKNC